MFKRTIPVETRHKLAVCGVHTNRYYTIFLNRYILRVIVVDDDHDSVRTLSTLLEIKGVSVEGKGYDGKEAVELYKDVRPDAVLLDMMMPEYDGKYAIKNLKKEDKDVKIIVLTAYKPNYEFEENEVAAVFDKPYKISEVIEAISK